MVFPRHFSTGCTRCRKRKVKCDEGRPSCQRCHTYGKVCPGYEDPFRSWKPSDGSRRGKRPMALTGKSRMLRRHKSPPASCVDDFMEAARMGTAQPPAIAQGLHPSYEDVSLAYFLCRFVTRRDEYFPGYLNFTLENFDNQRRGVMEYATLAAAHMAAYNQFGGNQFLQESYENYGLAIRMLQESMLIDKKATDDGTIAAVLLLCTFMDISGQDTCPFSRHAPGLYYLMEKRGLDQLNTRRGFEIFYMSALEISSHSILNNDYRYKYPVNLVMLAGASDPLMRVAYLGAKISVLRPALAECVTTPPLGSLFKQPNGLPTAQSTEKMQLVYCCLDTMNEFDSWDREAAVYWRWALKDRVEPPVLGKSAGANLHYDSQTACTIILVRCLRLVFLLDLLQYYYKMELHIAPGNSIYKRNEPEARSGKLVAKLEHDCRLAVTDILFCAQYALGDSDMDGSFGYDDGACALFILRPIIFVKYCPFSSSEQVVESETILSRIKSAMGTRSAALLLNERHASERIAAGWLAVRMSQCIKPETE